MFAESFLDAEIWAFVMGWQERNKSFLYKMYSQHGFKRNDELSDVISESGLILFEIVKEHIEKKRAVKPRLTIADFISLDLTKDDEKQIRKLLFGRYRVRTWRGRNVFSEECVDGLDFYENNVDYVALDKEVEEEAAIMHDALLLELLDLLHSRQKITDTEFEIMRLEIDSESGALRQYEIANRLNTNAMNINRIRKRTILKIQQFLKEERMTDLKQSLERLRVG